MTDDNNTAAVTGPDESPLPRRRPKPDLTDAIHDLLPGVEVVTEPARRGRPKGAAKPPRQRRNVTGELASLQAKVATAIRLLTRAGKCGETADSDAVMIALVQSAIDELTGGQP